MEDRQGYENLYDFSQVYAEEQVKLDFHPLPSHHDPYFRCVQDKYAGYTNHLHQPQLTHNPALTVHRDNFGCHYSSQIPPLHAGMPPPPPPSMPPPPAPPRSPGFYPFPNIHETPGTHTMESDISLLAGHHQLHHPPAPVQSPYCCAKCGLDLHTKADLQKHYFDIHGMTRVYCNQCDFVTNSYNNLVYHEKVVHIMHSSSAESQPHLHHPSLHPGLGGVGVGMYQPEPGASHHLIGGDGQVHLQHQHEPRTPPDIDDPMEVDVANQDEVEVNILTHDRETPQHTGQGEEVTQNLQEGVAVNKTKENIIGPFNCNVCQFSSNIRKSLQNHIIQVHNQNSHQCKECSFKAASKDSLLKHMDTKHSGNQFSCTDCHYITNSKQSLKLHTQNIHLGVRYPCPKCDYKATSASYIRVHIQSVHNKVKHPCDHCDHRASSHRALMNHISSLHNNDRIICTQCEYSAPTPGALRVHEKTEHEGLRYSCPHCEYQSKSSSYLKKHIQSKHEGVKHPCDYCEFQGATATTLNRHVEAFHSGLQFKCRECDHVTTTLQNLRAHRKKEHLGVRYPCDECDFKAVSKSYLKVHIDSQHKNVKHKCDICDKLCCSRTSLTAHKRNIHQNKDKT